MKTLAFLFALAIPSIQATGNTSDRHVPTKGYGSEAILSESSSPYDNKSVPIYDVRRHEMKKPIIQNPTDYSVTELANSFQDFLKLKKNIACSTLECAEFDGTLPNFLPIDKDSNCPQSQKLRLTHSSVCVTSYPNGSSNPQSPSVFYVDSTPDLPEIFDALPNARPQKRFLSSDAHIFTTEISVEDLQVLIAEKESQLNNEDISSFDASLLSFKGPGTSTKLATAEYQLNGNEVKRSRRNGTGQENGTSDPYIVKPSRKIIEYMDRVFAEVPAEVLHPNGQFEMDYSIIDSNGVNPVKIRHSNEENDHSSHEDSSSIEELSGLSNENYSDDVHFDSEDVSIENEYSLIGTEDVPIDTEDAHVDTEDVETDSFMNTAVVLGRPTLRGYRNTSLVDASERESVRKSDVSFLVSEFDLSSEEARKTRAGWSVEKHTKRGVQPTISEARESEEQDSKEENTIPEVIEIDFSETYNRFSAAKIEEAKRRDADRLNARLNTSQKEVPAAQRSAAEERKVGGRKTVVPAAELPAAERHIIMGENSDDQSYSKIVLV